MPSGSPLPGLFFPALHIKALGKPLLVLALVVPLVGCGLSEPLPEPERPAAVQPDLLDQRAPLVMEPGGTMGALGVNLDLYFADDLPPLGRVERLEKTVTALQQDLAKVVKLIQNRQPVLAAVPLPEAEKDRARAATAPLALTPPPSPPSPPMEPASEQPPSASVPVSLPPVADSVVIPPAPVVQKEEKATEPIAKPIPKIDLSGPLRVERLRFGVRNGTTRMVFDLTGDTSYSYALDNAEDLLIVEIAGAGWEAREAWQANGGLPLISSYNIQPMDDGGARVIFLLKDDVKVQKELTLDPDKNNYHRIVLDLAAES